MPRLSHPEIVTHYKVRIPYKDDRIQEVACWAHVRRKFYDLEQAHGSPLAREALERIAAFYAIEDEIRGRPPDERQQVRQARARPLLHEHRLTVARRRTRSLA